MVDLMALLNQNPVLGSLLGVGAAGSLLYGLKEAGYTAVAKAKRQLTTTLELHTEEPAFDWVNEWLSHHPSVHRARTLQVKDNSPPSSASSDEFRKKTWNLMPGNGDLWIWHDGGPVFIHRERNEKRLKDVDKLTLTTIGRSQARLRSIVADARKLRDGEERLYVYLWRGSWESIQPKRPREASTLFLPDRVVEEALADAGWFFGAEELHAKRGIPYRRGWLLEGEPRSGKSSLVAAVASHFKRPICYVNLSTVLDDNELISAFSSAEKGAIFLIEDADASGGAAKRRPVDREMLAAAADEAERGLPSTFDVKDIVGKGITLSGLLNSIDGVPATEGRLLVITTNFVERLDPALLGGGRVGRRWRFGKMQRPEAERMARAFFEDGVPPEVRERIEAWRPVAAADWQEALIAAEQARVGRPL
jgi:mitochondrial chaperone BCS1